MRWKNVEEQGTIPQNKALFREVTILTGQVWRLAAVLAMLVCMYVLALDGNTGFSGVERSPKPPQSWQARLYKDQP